MCIDVGVFCFLQDGLNDPQSRSTFALNGKLGRGVFKLFDEFIDVDYNNGQKGHWGFYPWLDEMINHDHKLHLYNIDKSLKINDILAKI